MYYNLAMAPPKKSDRLQLRDLPLKERIDAAVERAKKAGIKINRSEILRTAAWELMDKVDSGEPLSIKMRIPPVPKK